MKKLNKLFVSVVLSLLLSASAFANDGIIWTWVTSPTPPPTAATTNAPAPDGIILTGFTSTDTGTGVALGLLQSVLALF